MFVKHNGEETSSSETLPRITIVTPSFNQGHYLKQCIESVLSQDYPQTQHIVIDGGSTDDSREILLTYQNKLASWSSKPDKGQTFAINRGLRMSDGDLVTWLNSDDFYLPGALHSLAQAYLTSDEKTTGMYIGGGIKVSAQGVTLKNVPSSNYDKTAIYSVYRILQPSVFYSREAIMQCGMLDESLEYAMDWDIAMRIRQQYDDVLINRYLSAQRIYSDTKTATGGWRRLREMGRIGKKNNGVLDRNWLMYCFFSVLLGVKADGSYRGGKVRAGVAQRIKIGIEKLIGERNHMIHW